jgi:large subunit ribosomal protein L18e
MAMSQTRIKTHLKSKTNPELVQTINMARKESAWLMISRILAGSTRNHSSVNLNQIQRNSEEGKTVVIPGKVLGNGDLTKKVKVVALSFSSSAEIKLKKLKVDYSTIAEEIKKNPKAKEVQIIK